jgi:hypothetical protein
VCAARSAPRTLNRTAFVDPTSDQTGGCGTRPSCVPGAVLAEARRSAGRQVGGAFGRRSLFQTNISAFGKIET